MRVAAACLSFALFACGPSAGTDDDDGDDGDDNFDEFVDAGEAQACQKMDILFVVDNSGSMREEQTNLTSNFPDFIDVIHNHVTSDGAALDYRVAVTTTGRDVQYTVQPPPPFDILPPTTFNEQGEDGELLQKCGMNKRWLSRDDTNVSTTFSCLANVGTSGPSLEMPLHAIELAFGARVADGTNAGFLREDALLALVILTDEDDCSRRDNNFTIESDQCMSGQPNIIPIAEQLQYLDGVTGARGRWAAAVVAGPGPGTCQSSFGEAFDALRLKEFVAATGDNAVFSSICEGDLSTALSAALSTFTAACEGLPPIE